MKNQMIQQNGNRFLLRDKVAVIFGAGRAIGSQVAREFSNEGATLFFSGRHLASSSSLVAKDCPQATHSNGLSLDFVDDVIVHL
jgi:3-oxoacyl-[acyl-carrier protein] reductase